MFKISFLFLILINFTACSIVGEDGEDSATEFVISDYIYYGDINNNDVLKINYRTMELNATLKSDGVYPYEITNGFDNELLVLNRDLIKKTGV